MWTYDDLLTLDPDTFEELIASLWQAMGYDVTRVGGPGDQGVDVIARLNRGIPLTIHIQAKCYAPRTRVGVREIREYSSLLLAHQADTVVVICTSGFTEPALEEARKLGVRTIDGTELVRLLNQYQVPNPLHERPSVPPLSDVPNNPPSSQAQLAQDKPRLPIIGHPGWALVLLTIGVGGFGALITEGFSTLEFFLSLICFLAGLALGIRYLDARRAVRRLQIALELTEAEARSLVAAGLKTIDAVARAECEKIAPQLGSDITRAYQVISRARTANVTNAPKVNPERASCHTPTSTDRSSLLAIEPLDSHQDPQIKNSPPTVIHHATRENNSVVNVETLAGHHSVAMGRALKQSYPNLDTNRLLRHRDVRPSLRHFRQDEVPEAVLLCASAVFLRTNPLMAILFGVSLCGGALWVTDRRLLYVGVNRNIIPFRTITISHAYEEIESIDICRNTFISPDWTLKLQVQGEKRKSEYLLISQHANIRYFVTLISDKCRERGHQLIVNWRE